jgi:hypothetical protein
MREPDGRNSRERQDQRRPCTELRLLDDAQEQVEKSQRDGDVDAVLLDHPAVEDEWVAHREDQQRQWDCKRCEEPPRDPVEEEKRRDTRDGRDQPERQFRVAEHVDDELLHQQETGRSSLAEVERAQQPRVRAIHEVEREVRLVEPERSIGEESRDSDDDPDREQSGVEASRDE